MSDPEICLFPKHKGRRWIDIVIEDRDYVEWLVSGEPDFELWDWLYEMLMDLLEDTQ